MASSSSSLQRLAVFFFLLLAIHSAAGDPATQLRIDEICRQLEDYGFCSQTFKENLEAPADFAGLATIAIRVSLRNASSTLQFIVQLMGGTVDAPTRAALETCRTSYIAVAQAFQQADYYFKQGDYYNMVRVEKDAPRVQANCVSPVPESPLVEMNREMRILIAMAAVAGHFLAP